MVSLSSKAFYLDEGLSSLANEKISLLESATSFGIETLAFLGVSYVLSSFKLLFWSYFVIMIRFTAFFADPVMISVDSSSHRVEFYWSTELLL